MNKIKYAIIDVDSMKLATILYVQYGPSTTNPIGIAKYNLENYQKEYSGTYKLFVEVEKE